MNPSSLISLSALDEERFGVRTAKTTPNTLDDVQAILSFCQSNSVELLIARCSTHDLRAVQLLENEGFFITDTLVYYRRNLLRFPIPEDTGQIRVRAVQPGDEIVVRKVAAEAFHGYYGHYHADPRLDQTKCNEVYVDWATRSCLSREVADEVLTGDDDETLVGFATMRLNNADESEGVLFGVAPSAQGKGLYRSFMVAGMNWSLRKGASQMVVSTQITNIAVQKVWVRLGFEPSHSYYTLHKWFTP